MHSQTLQLKLIGNNHISLDFDMRYPQWKPNIPEVHVAILGANGSGKSALTVKYMTRRYISEYDPNLEDTYCRHDVVNSQECMVWIMDTVEGANKDPNRYMSWADIFFILYDVTNRLTFEYAERLMRAINQHEHSLCSRQHHVYLIGNKSDMDRYRQVSRTQGSTLAAEFNTECFETNCTEQYALVGAIFHHAIQLVFASDAFSHTAAAEAATARRSASPSPLNLDPLHSAQTQQQRMARSSKSPTTQSHLFQRRSRTKSPAGSMQLAAATADKTGGTLPHKKSTATMKFLKIFQ